MDKIQILQFKLQPVGGIVDDMRHNRKIIISMATIILTYIILSTFVFWFFESSVKREHPISGIDYLYFTVINVTTVGFGDISPMTGWGKVIAMANAIAGLIFFGFLVAAITAALQPSEFKGEGAISSSNDMPSEKSPVSEIDAFLHGITAILNAAANKGASHEIVKTGDGVVHTSIEVHLRGGNPNDEGQVRMWIEVRAESRLAPESKSS